MNAFSKAAYVTSEIHKEVFVRSDQITKKGVHLMGYVLILIAVLAIAQISLSLYLGRPLLSIMDYINPLASAYMGCFAIYGAIEAIKKLAEKKKLERQ
jgi:hypothetical protein